MGDIISAFFSTPILFRALVVGILVSLCAALLGVSLVLKRYSMIGDGLSHVGFGALAIAAVMNWAPMAVAVPVVIAAAFLLLRISGSSQGFGTSEQFSAAGNSTSPSALTCFRTATTPC